ncbi:zinc knuckle [Ostertagia ostertagi]
MGGEAQEDCDNTLGSTENLCVIVEPSEHMEMAGIGSHDSASSSQISTPEAEFEAQDKCTRKDEEIRALKEELEKQKRRVAELESPKNCEGQRAYRAEVPGRVSRETSSISGDNEQNRQLQSGWHKREKKKACRRGMCSSSSRRSCTSLSTFYDSTLSSNEERMYESKKRVPHRKHRVGAQNVMGEYLKFIALPGVVPYSGKDKEYPFEHFVEAFELKYPGQYWEDKERCALFRSKLAGKARAQFEALAKAKKRNFYTLVNAMKEVCREESRNKKVVALGELKRLRKPETQSVGDFCVELERLTRRAYPELGEDTLSIIRADHLYDQISHWDESCHLQEALEGPGSDMYERLKDAAMRAEWRHLSLKNRKSTEFSQTTGVTSRGQRNVRRNYFKENDVSQIKAKSSVELEDNEDRKGNKERLKCFKCKSTGHKARECKTTATSEVSRPVSLSARVRGVKCTKVHSKHGHIRNRSPHIFGKRSTIEVTILGKDRKALLDTGSQISILPSIVLQEAMDDGIDIDAVVKEIALPKSLKITDASGKAMKFLTAVEVDVVNRSDNKLNRVRMLVSKTKEKLIILGTNAIPQIGYEVRKIGHKEEDKEVEQQQKEVENSSAATVARRVFIAPGQTEYVDLKCEEKCTEAMLNSSDKRVPNSLCKVNIGVAKVAVVNVTSEPIVMRKGQEVEIPQQTYYAAKANPCPQRKKVSDTYLRVFWIKNQNGSMAITSDAKDWRTVSVNVPIGTITADARRRSWNYPTNGCDDYSCGYAYNITPAVKLQEKSPSFYCMEVDPVIPHVPFPNADVSKYNRFSSMIIEGTRVRCSGRESHVHAVRCRVQDFPAFKGGPSFALANCCVSKTMTAADLIAVLPHPARALPIECVLEAARVFAIWMQTGSVALNTQRIMNLDDRVVDPRSLGFAYAVFRKKCAHVSTMARAIEPATIMRHGSLSRGWPTVPQRIFELGWLVARKLDKNDFDLNSMMDRIHNRILIVVPMVLRRMAWMSGGCRTRVFFYGDFAAIKTKMDSLFTDDLGAVVLILPPEEPRKVTSWLAIMSAINLWTTCGTHVYLVNGPRTVNIVSWEHVTMKMRAHILSYVSEQPEHAQLIVDVLQQNIGVMDPRAAWAAVGVLKNATEWQEESTRTFHQFLRSQLEPLLTLEELRLAPFRAHKRKEPGLPAPVEESSKGPQGVNAFALVVNLLDIDEFC